MVIGADNLTLEERGELIAGPEENVMLSTVTIKCVSGKGGFSFINSSCTNIRGLTFLACGTNHFQHSILDFSYAVIFIQYVKRFEFDQNSVHGNKGGFGLLFHQCNEVVVTNSYFFGTNHDQYLNGSSESNCPGDFESVGAIRFEQNNFTESKLKISNSNFIMCCGNDYCSNCHGAISIFSNSIEMLYVSLSHLIFSKNSGSFNFASGITANFSNGPVSLHLSNSVFKQGSSTGIGILAEKTSSLNLTIQETQILNNTGDGVSNLYIRGNLQSTVQILKSHFIQNVIKEPTAEDGIWISGCNRVHFKELTVQFWSIGSSIAIIGHSYYTGATPTAVLIEKSSFSQNKNMQSVLILQNLDGTLSNCNFTDNSDGLSVVTVSHSMVVFMNCSISNNNMTGVTVMNEGFVRFYADNKIENNRASEGAGIKLQLNSLMDVVGTLLVYNNIAEGVGGGISLLSCLILPLLKSDLSNVCTLSFAGDNPLIKFSGNRACKAGSDIYGLKLMDCYNSGFFSKAYVPKVITETTHLTTPSLKYFHFSNDTDQLSSMSSKPIMVCFCNKSSFPNCSVRTHYITTYPGREIKTTIATVGYYGGTSPGTVLVSTENATLLYYYGQNETKTCFLFHILLANPKPTSAQVDIRVRGGLNNWSVSLVVNIVECPLGFDKGRDSGQCECVPLLAENSVKCNVSFKPYMFRRSGNSWFAYINSSQCITGVKTCPFDYCKRSTVSFDMTMPDQQCVGNRTGILCGQCHSDLSLMLGSKRCASCTNYYLFLLPVFAIAGIILVAILMLLNLTVSVGTINGLLFYANMIKLNESFFFSSGTVPVVSQFISWLNLDLGIEVCLFDGLDGYWKTWLQFAFPAYLFLLMAGIIIGSHYSVRICRLCGSHAVPALATLFLMSYTKILRTVTDALSMSQLTCNDSTLTVWSVDGNIAYGRGKHLPLVIFSSIVLVFGLAYPVLVLFAPVLEKHSHKCIALRCNPVPRLKPILDAYGGPYKDRYRFWTGITLFL